MNTSYILKDKSENFFNAVKPLKQMVFINSGSFMMGSPRSDEIHKYNEIYHKVNITNSFYISKYLVTQKLWKEIMGYVPTSILEDNGRTGLSKPVVYISWYEAMNFCKILTLLEQKEGNIPDNWEYSLPTEAQWEYACKANLSDKDFFANKNILDYGYFLDKDNCSDSPLPCVGKKKPNAWGLYDMLGTIEEYCKDDYTDYLNASCQTNPVHKNSNDKYGSPKVIKGGLSSINKYYNRKTFHLPSFSHRNGWFAEETAPDIGFRICLYKKR